MFSKLNWPQYFAQYPAGLPAARPNLILLEIDDVYLERQAVQRLQHHLKPYLVWGNELADDWAEQNLLSGDLFREERPILVLAAGKVAAGIKEFFQRAKFSQGHRPVIFLLGKSPVWPEEFKTSAQALWLKVEGPKFWEAPALVNFFIQEKKLHFSSAVKSYLAQTLPAESAKIDAACHLLALHYPSQNDAPHPDLTPAAAAQLLGPPVENIFNLAALWGRHQQKQVLAKILAQEDFVYWANCFGLLSNHLLKLADPTYWQWKKKKSSKYDQEIMQASKSWSDSDLQHDLRLLQTWECQALARDPLLADQLRQAQRQFE